MDQKQKPTRKVIIAENPDGSMSMQVEGFSQLEALGALRLHEQIVSDRLRNPSINAATILHNTPQQNGH